MEDRELDFISDTDASVRLEISNSSSNSTTTVTANNNNNDNNNNRNSVNEELIEKSVQNYLNERKKRKDQFKYCCSCNSLFYYRIPIIDLINENIFFRYISLILFIKIFFLMIYFSRVWLFAADEHLTKAMETCDEGQTLLRISFVSGLTLVTAWSLSFLNNVTKLSIKFRFLTFSIVTLVILIDLILQITHIVCFNNNVFNNPDTPSTFKSFTFIDPNNNVDINYMNITNLESFQNILKYTYFDIKYNLSVAQYNVFKGYIIIFWILSFLFALIIYFSFIFILIEHEFCVHGKYLFSFYGFRLKKYYEYVSILLTNTFKRKNNLRQSSSSVNSIMLSENNDTIDDYKSKQEDNELLSTSDESVDSIDERFSKKLQFYWKESNRNIIIRFLVSFWMTCVFYCKRKYLKLKRTIKKITNPKSVVNYFFPTRLWIGVFSSLLITILLLVALTNFLEPICYGIVNAVFGGVVLFICSDPINNEELLQCQKDLVPILLPLTSVSKSSLILGSFVTFTVILIILLLIMRQFKHDLKAYRRGKLNYPLNEVNMLQASDFSGMQFGHTTISTVLYFFVAFDVISVIGIIIQVVFPILKSQWEVFANDQSGMKTGIIIYITFSIVEKPVFIIIRLIQNYSKKLFLLKEDNWLVNLTSHSFWDFGFTLFNYLFGLIIALIVSIFKFFALGFIRFLRLDSPDNPGFHSYLAMLKVEVRNANPVINVFASIVKHKAKEYENKFNELSTTTMDCSLTTSDIAVDEEEIIKEVKKCVYNDKKKPKLKNYLLKIGFLHSNKKLNEDINNDDNEEESLKSHHKNE
ncbi:hypothetical protein ABK040_001629 [Willaertia magna]